MSDMQNLVEMLSKKDIEFSKAKSGSWEKPEWQVSFTSDANHGETKYVINFNFDKDGNLLTVKAKR